jgi:hypothetical protein
MVLFSLESISWVLQSVTDNGRPSDLSKICQERIRLLREYKDGATHYAERVCQMTELAIAGHEIESNAARRLCREAWDTAEISRLALARHEADHACDRAESSAAWKT